MSWSKKFKNKKNPKYRDYITTAIIGGKRQGKTSLVKLLIDNYVKIYPYRRVLVFDPSDAFKKEYDFPGYKQIGLQELFHGKKMRNGSIRYWSAGIRRILDVEDDNDFHDLLLNYMMHHFENGLIVIDEATILFPSNPSKLQKSLVIKHTNRKIDLWMVFHTLQKVPPSFRSEIWDYIFFKTFEGYTTPKQIENMRFPKPEEFFSLWKEAQEAPSKADQIIQYFTVFNSKQ